MPPPMITALRLPALGISVGLRAGRRLVAERAVGPSLGMHQLHDAQAVTHRLTEALAEEGIAHVTLQAECHPCEEPDC